MDFLINPVRANNVIRVTTTGSAATATELGQQVEFGPIIVELGGAFVGPPAFNLGSRQVQIRPDTEPPLNHVETFNEQTDPRAAAKAQAYIYDITQRIITAKNEWDSLISTLTPSQFTA